MQGHEKEALHLMSTYLPKETGPGSVYSEGGGLYALGEHWAALGFVMWKNASFWTCFVIVDLAATCLADMASDWHFNNTHTHTPV